MVILNIDKVLGDRTVLFHLFFFFFTISLVSNRIWHGRGAQGMLDGGGRKGRHKKEERKKGVYAGGRQEETGKRGKRRDSNQTFVLDTLRR